MAATSSLTIANKDGRQSPSRRGSTNASKQSAANTTASISHGSLAATTTAAAAATTTTPTTPSSAVAGAVTPTPTPVASSKATRRRKDRNLDGVHRVTFTFTTAMAVPTVIEDDLSQSTDSKGTTTKKRRLLDAPKAHSYFHHEYKLLPDEEEPVKTDVVCFGVAAKIYTEKQEPKVLKTWIEGKKTWIAWSHCHTVTVTNAILDKIFAHRLHLRVWDHKEKLSTRAKFDRPKAFRMPASTGEESDVSSGVKNMIQKQVRNYCKLWPRKNFINKPLPIFDAVAMAAIDKAENEAAAKAAADAMALEKEKQQRREEVSALVGGDKLPYLSPGNVSTLVTLDTDRSVKPTLGSRSFSRIGRLAGLDKPNESRENMSPSGGGRGRNSGGAATASKSKVLS